MPFMRIADEYQTLVMTDKSEISKADTNAAILSVLATRVCVCFCTQRLCSHQLTSHQRFEKAGHPIFHCNDDCVFASQAAGYLNRTENHPFPFITLVDLTVHGNIHTSNFNKYIK